MKKLICLLLVFMLLMAITVPTLAIGWAAPAMSASASPFKAEVIKLQINNDVTGSEYFTVLPDAAAYGFSKIYYAIKLTLPSVADANAYYGTKDLVVGSKIKVTIDYGNIAGKRKEVVNVPLAGTAQTLWYDGVEFSPGWVEALQYTKTKHILTGTAESTAMATIQVCIASKNTLGDILIDNCYRIAEKQFYGVRTCPNCKAVNMEGYLVSGECGKADVFIAVKPASKAVTGVYVIDKDDPAANYEGAIVQVDKPLYRWEIVGQTDYCDYHGCKHAKYGFAEIFKDAEYSVDGRLAAPADSDGTFAEYCDRNKVRADLRDFGAVYYTDDDGIFHPVAAASPWWPAAALCHKDGTAYGPGDALHYLDVYYKVDPYTDSILHKMMTAESVDCDTNEKTYLNAANYVMGKLGFIFADIAAGKVYMTVDNILSNFGYAVNDCATASWGAYTAAISVAPIVEVPATGGAPWWTRLLEVLGVS